MTAPTFDVICRRMAESLGVAETRVCSETELADLAADSYRLVEMAIELQDDFDVILSQGDLNGVITVGDLAELIRARAG